MNIHKRTESKFVSLMANKAIHPKQYIYKNDGTLNFHMLKWVKGIAETMNVDEFSVWFVQQMIIPYPKNQMPEWICKLIGFKKVVTIDKIYLRLNQLELIP